MGESNFTRTYLLSSLGVAPAFGLALALLALLLRGNFLGFAAGADATMDQLLVQGQFVLARERLAALSAWDGGRLAAMAPPIVQDQRGLAVVVAIVRDRAAVSVRLVLADSAAQPTSYQPDHVLVADVPDGSLVDLARCLLLAAVLLLDEDHVVIVFGGGRPLGRGRDRHFGVIPEKLRQREALLGHDDAIFLAKMLLVLLGSGPEHRLAKRRS